MRVGSLFAGIGGFDLGLARSGMRTVWVVERDPFCQFVLRKNFPDAQRFSDVRKVSFANLEPVDVLCGGFPCQDISGANNTAQGLDGEKSSLWSEFARLISELRPEYVVIENSPMLTARGLDKVLCDLAARGYDAEWNCLSANAVGALHIRNRIFIIAYPHRDGLQGGRGERGLVASETRWSRWRDGIVRSNWWSASPEPQRVVDGLSERMDSDWSPRTKALGNALVPQVAEFIGSCIMEDHATRNTSSGAFPAIDTSCR